MPRKRKTVSESDAGDDIREAPLMVEQPVVEIPATKLKNASGKVANIPGMGANNVKPGGTIPIPKNPSHVQFLRNHGFELA